MSKSLFDAAERKAEAAEKDIALAKSLDEVLQATIDAAELYVQTLRLAPSSEHKARVEGRCKKLLTKAETLKAASLNTVEHLDVAPKPHLKHPISKRRSTKREEIILLKGSKLNGFVFPPWKDDPAPGESALKAGEEAFVDSPPLRLSRLQLKTFAGWNRPREALGRLHIAKDGIRLPTEPTMQSIGKVDLVQDVTSDCSVVASLCAGSARSERGHPTLFSSIMYPCDGDTNVPVLSPSCKYILRLYFNGCYRRVVVDDLLPSSTDSRIFHVVDRQNPGCLWPALVEKAYLKVRGGYDFPGSNSGTDLAVLTGWLPEQVFLYNNEVMPEELWTRIFRAFTFGDVLITMGTGKLSQAEQRQRGLVTEHDYAVLDMKETTSARQFLLKNPWSDGNVWRGGCGQEVGPVGEVTSSPRFERLNIRHEEALAPGTFWMDLGNVFQNFENLYLNWNPGLFSHRQDYHFSWNLSSLQAVAGSMESNPQFCVKCSRAGSLWLFLNRHFRTGDYQNCDPPAHGFISLYLFDREGGKVLLSDGALIRGPYVDSPNTLIKIEAQPNKIYTLVPAVQDPLAAKLNFTLSALSRGPLELSLAVGRYLHVVSQLAAWTRSTAGGNSDSIKYLANPQFSLRLSNKAEIAILLACVLPERQHRAAVHIKVLFTDGSRVTSLRSRDIVAHSGDYRLGSAAIETTLEQGTYTIICSTFEPGQLGEFKLSVHTSSEHPPRLVPLLSEISGRLVTTPPPATFSAGVNRVLAPLYSSRLTRASLVVRSLHNPAERSRLHASSPIEMTLEQGQGPYKSCLAQSPAPEDTEYRGSSGSVEIKDFDIRPEFQDPAGGGLWLVLQRTAGGSGQTQSEERFQIVIMAEERVDIGAWGYGDG